MHVLALDTTTAAGSVAIATNGRIVDVRLLDSARPQTTQLPGAVLDLLAGAGMVLGQIDAFAVAIGPGSFSGIRIGIACTQGLAQIGRAHV